MGGKVAKLSPRQRQKRYSMARFKRKRKRLMIIVATTSLPAVDRPNADRWNAARSCQFVTLCGP